jgi:membrane protease YdiL (CAAX protease family)
MAPGAVSWKGIVLFALALTAVDQAGCLVIQNGAEWIGLTPKWEEGLDETILFGSLPLALFTMVDGVIWAPLFEEIVFRGLLYVTLRTRLTPIPAALLSAGLFGAVHPYSLVGFLEVTWTGFILAIGYEKCRSLWPCIFAHFFNNLFFFGALLLVYR